MKKYFSAVFILLFKASLILAADQMHEKPPPPQQLNAIFEDFSHLGGHFRSGEWKDAIKATDRIYATFNKMLPQLKRHIPAGISRDFSRDFSATMTDLRNSLIKKDMKETEIQYIRIQRLFLAITDNYAYEVPPVMSFIDKDISEAEQALKKKNYKRVVIEMNEVGDFFYEAEYLLREKGVHKEDIQEFSSIVREVRAAGEARNAKKAEIGIQNLKALSAKFLQLF